MPVLPQLTLQQRRRKPWPDKLQMNLDDALFAQHAVGFLSVRDSEDAQPLTDQASPLALDDPTCNHMRKTLQQLPVVAPTCKLTDTMAVSSAQKPCTFGKAQMGLVAGPQQGRRAE